MIPATGAIGNVGSAVVDVHDAVLTVFPPPPRPKIEPGADTDADLRGGFVPHSSRERPGNVKKQRERWSIESAGQERDFGHRRR
jgi:hypothetical protein